VLAYVIVFAAATVGARLFVRLPDGPLLIRIFALTLLANLVTETAGGILQALGRFRLLSALRVAGRAATLGAVTVAWLAGGAMYELVWALVAGAAVSAALLTVSALRSARRDLGTSVWRAPLAELAERGEALRFMLSTNVSGMLSLLAKSDTDMLWLGFFCTPAQTGLYRIGMNLVTVVMAPVGPLGQATFPQIAHCAAAANWGQFRKLLRQTTTLVAALVVPAAVGMVLMGPWFLRTFYGPDFVPAARVMNIVVVGMAFASVLFWTRPALLALGLPGFQLRIAVWVAVLKVVGTLLVLPTFGYLGNAVLLTLLCFFAAGTTAARVHAVLKANERAARLA